MSDRRTSIGFACTWARPPERTWSHIPWNLRRALRNLTDVVDIAGQPPWPIDRAVGKVTRALWGQRSDWRSWAAYQAFVTSRVRVGARRRSPSAVLEIGDLARLPMPHFFYQDLSVDLLIEAVREHGPDAIEYPNLDLAWLRRRADRQRQLYETVDGVLAMSAWLADALVAGGSCRADQVTVVYAGCSPAVARPDAVNPRPGPHRRLLFVGRHFRRKGGDIVVAALGILRREFDPNVTLTIVGPPVWPLDGTVPPGVHFLGDVPTSRLASEMERHDLFVMPSRFEPFGIAPVEALASGMPCVVRDAYAMPEVVRAGDNGALVGSLTADEVARAIVTCLEDPSMFVRCQAERAVVLQRFSWDAVAARVLDGIATRV